MMGLHLSEMEFIYGMAIIEMVVIHIDMIQVLTTNNFTKSKLIGLITMEDNNTLMFHGIILEQLEMEKLYHHIVESYQVHIGIVILYQLDQHHIIF